MPAQQSSLLLSTCSACCPELQAPKVRGLLHVVASAHRTQPLGSSSQKQHQNSETRVAETEARSRLVLTV